jgi:hypothetical protein
MTRGFNLFVILSGFGWLIDILVFTYLSTILNFSPFLSNFFSSLLATLLVWITWYQALFRHNMSARTVDISLIMRGTVYCVYQICSIIFYSLLVSIVFIQLLNVISSSYILYFEKTEFTLVLSKALITPISLLTNFTFSKIVAHWS